MSTTGNGAARQEETEAATPATGGRGTKRAERVRQGAENRASLESLSVSLPQFCRLVGASEGELSGLIRDGVLSATQTEPGCRASAYMQLSVAAAVQQYSAHMRMRLAEAEAVEDHDGAKTALGMRNALISNAGSDPAIVMTQWTRILAAVHRVLSALPEKIDRALPMGLTRSERRKIEGIIKDAIEELARPRGTKNAGPEED